MIDVDIQGALQLYDKNRFLDAYHLTLPAWRLSHRDIHSLSIETLVHGGRLAARLGGTTLQRILWRAARRQDPTHPLVRYFASHGVEGRWNVLDAVRAATQDAWPDDEIPHLRASRLGSDARVLAWVRDFAGAHRLIARGRAIGLETSWLDACEAEIFLHQDRWAEAFAAACRGWESSPGTPALASVLARVAVRLDKVDEVTNMLVASLDQVQSYETQYIAVSSLLCSAERATGPRQVEYARRAYSLGTQLDALTPLSSRDTRNNTAGIQAIAAFWAHDRHGFGRHAAQVSTPFFRQIVRNLSTTEAAGAGFARVVLPFRPVAQKHNTCVPASIACIAGGLGIEVDQDDIACSVTYGGTATWRIVDWLETHGFAVRLLTLTAELAETLVKDGLAPVIFTASLNSGHAVALVGMDAAAGVLLLYDPASGRVVPTRFEHFAEGETPFGPRALVFVPRSARHRLESIPEAACTGATATVNYERALVQAGLSTANRVIDVLATKAGCELERSRLDALHAAARGNAVTAYAQHLAMLAQHPDCVYLQRELLGNLERTRNAVLIRDALRDIVARGSRQATHLARYADCLGVQNAGYAEAERLLKRAIAYEPHNAEAFHVLGDILRRQERVADSVLPYRIAALLDTENEHYAAAHADALRVTEGDEAAIEFLRLRIDTLGNGVEGVAAWITLVKAYVARGRPDEATECLSQAYAAWPSSPMLATFATHFWIERGAFAAAQEAVQQLDTLNHHTAYLEGATTLAAAQGDHATALARAERWLHETPSNLDARRAVLRAVAKTSGPFVACAMAESWVAAFPGDDDLELVLYDALCLAGPAWRARQLLEQRVERNPLGYSRVVQAGSRLSRRRATQ